MARMVLSEGRRLRHPGAAGQIEYDEALRQAVSTNDLRLRIQMHEEGNDPDRLYDRISDLNLIS